MRLILSLCFASGVAGVADAHTLTGNEYLLSQLGHQLFGLHHLPLTAILILGGIAVFRFLRKTGRKFRS